jgi:aryl-alcohol dehydrogenase
MDILAAVARAPDLPFRLERLTLDAPRPDEILVRVEAVGVCHTDLLAKSHGMPIRTPAVFGHEGAGVVEKIGADVRKVRAGDRVVLTFRSCGACAHCGSGDPAYCRSMPQLNYRGSRADGSKTLRDEAGPLAGNFFGQSSFATHCLAYESNVVPLPRDIPFAVAATLGCGVQTGVGSILRSMACPAGSSLMVIGGGPVGLSAVIGAGLAGCDPVILVEPQAGRRELGLSFGATRALESGVDGAIDQTVAEIAPHGLDFVLDTSGVPEMLELAMRLLGARGMLGMVGVPPAGTRLPGNPLRLLTLGQSIRGIIEGDSDPDHFLPQLFSFYRDGQLPIDRMITTYAFGDINEAISAQKRGDCTKAVLLLAPEARRLPRGAD